MIAKLDDLKTLPLQRRPRDKQLQFLRVLLGLRLRLRLLMLWMR